MDKKLDIPDAYLKPYEPQCALDMATDAYGHQTLPRLEVDPIKHDLPWTEPRTAGAYIMTDVNGRTWLKWTI